MKFFVPVHICHPPKIAHVEQVTTNQHNGQKSSANYCEKIPNVRTFRNLELQRISQRGLLYVHFFSV